MNIKGTFQFIIFFKAIDSPIFRESSETSKIYNKKINYANIQLNVSGKTFHEQCINDVVAITFLEHY